MLTNNKMRINQSAQALFEMVIVIGVLVLILSGIVAVVTRSVKNTTFSSESAVASRYAQEAIEWIRVQRDTEGWDKLKNKAGQTFCIPAPPQWVNLNQCDLINGRYERTADLSFVAGNEDQIKVTVTVKWQDSAGEHNTQLETILTAWQEQ